MSTTTTKRPLASAKADAEAFRNMFFGCYERWEIAGSVRRGKPEVSDIEHVVIPKFGDVPGASLFGETSRVNLLWHALDQLIGSFVLHKHLYTSNHADGSTSVSPRWGDTYRGVDFNGFNHEIFCATPENFGAILVIRTGPADFSKNVVERMLRGGMYRQQGGGVVLVKTGEHIATPDEASFFKLASMSYIEPAARVV